MSLSRAIHEATERRIALEADLRGREIADPRALALGYGLPLHAVRTAMRELRVRDASV